jgi:hypothetical protein
MSGGEQPAYYINTALMHAKVNTMTPIRARIAEADQDRNLLAALGVGVKIDAGLNFGGRGRG